MSIEFLTCIVNVGKAAEHFRNFLMLNQNDNDGIGGTKQTKYLEQSVQWLLQVNEKVFHEETETRFHRQTNCKKEKDAHYFVGYFLPFFLYFFQADTQKSTSVYFDTLQVVSFLTSNVCSLFKTDRHIKEILNNLCEKLSIKVDLINTFSILFFVDTPNTNPNWIKMRKKPLLVW